MKRQKNFPDRVYKENLVVRKHLREWQTSYTIANKRIQNVKHFFFPHLTYTYGA